MLFRTKADDAGVHNLVEAATDGKADDKGAAVDELKSFKTEIVSAFPYLIVWHPEIKMNFFFTSAP